MDIDDIDVVIQLGLRDMDTFVHRSGRTARKGKDGLCISFFGMSQLKFILDCEQKLNINIEFATQIDDVVQSTEANQNQILQKLIAAATDKRSRDRMRVSPKDCDVVYDTLASD